MRERFHKVSNDQEHFSCGNGMERIMGSNCTSLKGKLFLHLIIIFLMTSRILKWKLYWLVYRESNQLTNQSWYSKSVWKSATPHRESYSTLWRQSTLSGGKKPCDGRLRIYGSYWQELGDFPELQRPLCVILLAGFVIFHHVVLSVSLEPPLLCILCCPGYVLAHPNAITLSSQSPFCHQYMHLTIQWEGKEPEGRQGERSDKSMKQIFYTSCTTISFFPHLFSMPFVLFSDKVVELPVGSSLMPFRYVECQVYCWLYSICQNLWVTHHKIFKYVA